MASLNEQNKNLYSSKLQFKMYFSVILKVLSLIVNLWIMKASYNLIESKELYGVWLTILSILSWLNLLNGGLGNGLRNKVASLLTKKDYKKAGSYISTSYFILSITLGLIGIIFYLLSWYIPWEKVFNINENLGPEVSLTIKIVILLYLVQLVLSLINSVNFAFQNSVLPNLLSLISNFLILIFIITYDFLEKTNLVLLGTTYTIVFVTVLFCANIYLYTYPYKNVRPSLNKVDISQTNILLGNGIKFFLLELAAIIIFTTDNFIIAHMLGNEFVATYQVTTRLFSIYTIGAATILTPLWSAYTQAYAKKDVVWIKKIFNNILKVILPFSIILIVFSVFAQAIIKIWMGEDFYVDQSTIILIAIFTWITVWSNVFAYFLNGINKINLQLIFVGIGAILNIPLSIYFATDLNFGLNGVILASIISLLPFSICGPIQTFYLIKNLNKR